MKSTKKRNPDERALKQKLSPVFEKRKRLVAEYLNSQSEKLKRLVLLAFGLVMGGLSLASLLQPFHGSPSISSILPTPIEMPALPLPPGSEDTLVTEDYRQLLHARLVLDSLRQSDPLRYDQLMRNRQGLLDSIDFLLRLYQPQK